MHVPARAVADHQTGLLRHWLTRVHLRSIDRPPCSGFEIQNGLDEKEDADAASGQHHREKRAPFGQ